MSDLSGHVTLAEVATQLRSLADTLVAETRPGGGVEWIKVNRLRGLADIIDQHNATFEQLAGALGAVGRVIRSVTVGSGAVTWEDKGK